LTDIKYVSGDILYAGPKGYAGIGFMPGVPGVSVRVGLTIFKFNARK
jgi:hypothetical protein